MGNRARQIVDRIYEGVDVRTAISEVVGTVFAPCADKLQKDSTANALAKKGEELKLVAYIVDNLDKLKFDRKLTRQEIRRVARELIARSISGAGGK